MAANDNKPADAAGSADKDKGRQESNRDKAAKNKDEIQFFEGTITKLVERENADGEKETVEVLSDNLYPGEKLKREVDEEKAEKDRDELRTRRKAEMDERTK